MSEDQKIIAAIKHIPVEEISQLPYFQNRGSRFVTRAMINDKQGERERLFSDVIKKFHEESHGGGLFNVVEADNQADLETAFTMFQWLTTNVGSSVLEEALRATGKKVVPLESN